jgi:hypothetical protein
VPHRIRKFEEGQQVPEGSKHLYTRVVKESHNHPTLTPKNEAYRAAHPELAHEWIVTTEKVYHYFLVYERH